ncbi:MAG: peptidylprolyl isomerase [Aeoliella sp.]
MSRRSRSHDSTHRSYQIRRWAMMLASAALVVGVALVCRHLAGTAEADAQSPVAHDANVEPASAHMPQHQPPRHDVMAIVNGQDINRRQLEKACIERYGEEVLESLVNKWLIQHHCKKRGINISRDEIEQEIDRMAKRFQLGREQWLQMLANERGIGEQEYRRDILWPTIALRKLAASDLTATDEELRREYETLYGPSVRARIIVLADQARAQQIQQQLTDNPNEFARLAMNESIDPSSASIGGLIQPIRKHLGDPGLEQAAFALEPGPVSGVLPIGEQFAILKCEGHNPPRQVAFAEVEAELAEKVREGKLRNVAGDLFTKLQETATIQNIYNDPQLSQQMPGVVALVNGDKVTLEELGKEALLRHGEEVLQIEIAHKLLEQAMRTAGASVSQDDLNAEIAHAAKLAGIVDNAGQADIQKWIETTTEEQGVSYEVYIRDSVWPSASLKKLTGSQVKVSNEDLQKGYEANYGQRVRCRAIVLGNMKRAQDVWQKARGNPSLDYFGDLAEEYSVEPTSKALRGEVPPIRKHGGQPQLEEVAYQLQPGELSGIIQVGDKLVILKCEGRTDPKEIEIEAVQEILMQDIFEKKLRIAMGQKYEEIRASARVDNYLAGTSQSPAEPKERAQRAGAAPRRDPAVRPAAATR